MKFGPGQLRPSGVNPANLNAAILSGAYVNCLHDSQPILSGPLGYGDPTGPTDGATNIAFWPGFPRGLVSEFFNIGVETLLGPAMDSTLGLVDISQDQTVDEGVIYNDGGLHPRNPYLYTVGSTPARLYRQSHIVEDASGLAHLAFGLFKLEANQPIIGDYDEAFYLDIIAGDVFLSTIKNSTAATPIDTGIDVADGDEVLFEVVIQGDTPRARVNGGIWRNPEHFVFDAAEKLIPKRQLVHGTDVSKIYPTLTEYVPLAAYQA